MDNVIPASAKSTMIRFSDELHAALKASAAENGRSLNSEMVIRLLSTFKEGEVEQAPETSKTTQFTTRLENSLMEKIKESAAKNKRSVNAEIELILTQFFGEVE
ncbi:Arc family DNA-binding protein [Stenotrophomonas maltophilia]|uniref:Arc family DNA-binding protein n=1 Tax=Stenotrophomonas maltophilia TaxID=40324 RepID=UPI002ACC5BF2|nr:Arc family DNA-binding protein [Stenotrophomonas maltophilia]MDZ5813867.1 Arc family DNA-binding protein [Stenotrophomonas maltophilia]